MQISNKCYYALRALFELAINRNDGTPLKIGEIAQRQQIPKRFLEVILSELRQGGFVESRRGVDGGYLLSQRADQISVGDIVRFVDGDLAPVSCVSNDAQKKECELNFECPFYEFWVRVNHTISEVYDGTTLADIAESWKLRRAGQNFNYEI